MCKLYRMRDNVNNLLFLLYIIENSASIYGDFKSLASTNSATPAR